MPSFLRSANSVNLTINPNIVARAYSELEREGLLATQQGRGTFVIELKDRSQLEGAGQQKLCDLVEETIVKARALGNSLDDIEECMEQRIRAWREQMNE